MECITWKCFFDSDTEDLIVDSDTENPAADSNHMGNGENVSSFDCFKRRGLHLLHVNCRSILRKIDELCIIAKSSNAAAIGVSETWIDSTVPDSEICIENYSILGCDRDRHGGGVCLYIRKDLACNPRSDLHSDQLESIWCEIISEENRFLIKWLR